MRATRVMLVSLGVALSVVPPAGATSSVGYPWAVAQRTVMVRLHPVGHGRVQGTAQLTAAGGGTKVVLDVRNLPPGARAYGRVLAGTCSDLSHLSASFSSLPNLTANARGRARAIGRVRFHIKGSENVRLSALTSGGDVIVIGLDRGLVACGNIPQTHMLARRS